MTPVNNPLTSCWCSSEEMIHIASGTLVINPLNDSTAKNVFAEHLPKNGERPRWETPRAPRPSSLLPVPLLVNVPTCPWKNILLNDIPLPAPSHASSRLNGSRPNGNCLEHNSTGMFAHTKTALSLIPFLPFSFSPSFSSHFFPRLYVSMSRASSLRLSPPTIMAPNSG